MWVVLALLGWLAVAGLVAVAVGRAASRGDEQLEHAHNSTPESQPEPAPARKPERVVQAQADLRVAAPTTSKVMALLREKADVLADDPPFGVVIEGVDLVPHYSEGQLVEVRGAARARWTVVEQLDDDGVWRKFVKDDMGGDAA